MKIRFLTFLSAFILLFSLHQGGYAAVAPTPAVGKRPANIKILLTEHAERTLLETRGRYFVYNADNNALLTITSTAKCDYLTALPEGLQWGTYPYTNAFRIRLIPDGESTLLIDGIEYYGGAYIEARKDVVCIVNELDIELFLACTLAATLPHDLETEAMEAAVIVARTHAYHVAQSSKIPLWDLTAKEIHYEGSGLIHRYPAIDRAIDHTQHMVLFHQDGTFPATWTEDCAGKTADYTTIFGTPATLPKGLNAPLAALSRELHLWSFEISKKEFAKLVKLNGISSIDLNKDEKSNKVVKIRVSYQGKELFLDFFAFQALIGSAQLKSNDFSLKIKGDQLVFTGYGSGHGVGLCLYSAKQLAKEGKKAPQILDSFFPETKLTRCVETR